MKEKFKEYNKKIYPKIPLNELVIYSLYKLSEEKKNISRQDLIAACFTMFPQRFSLSGYDEWPDTNYIQIRLLDCKNRGFLNGSPQHGYKITSIGKQLAKITEKKLKTGKFLVRKGFDKIDKRTKSNRIIRVLFDSTAYKKYKEKKLDKINEFDFRELLHCTMSSSLRDLQLSLDKLNVLAKEINNNETIVFLKKIKQIGITNNWIK